MICEQEHLRISFDALACPLCQTLSKLEAAEADRDYAREEAADKQLDLEQSYFDRFGR